MTTNITWEVFNKSVRVKNTSFSNDLILSVGDCITFNYDVITRPPNDCCVITSFTGYAEDSGPIGMTYLPWRHEENRWASQVFSLRGNGRHIICYPNGIPHYGQHINWSSLHLVDEIDDLVFKQYVQKLKYP